MRLFNYIAVLLFSVNLGFSQVYNQNIEAKIQTDFRDDFLTITGTALNKTSFNASLRYELSVIKHVGSNHSKNSQAGRFTLLPNEGKELSKTTINLDDKAKIIILLLIYDIDDQLVGKDRLVLNENKNESIQNQQANVKNMLNKLSANDDVGFVLRGVVTQEMKTKAGNDFYNYFSTIYRQSGINSQFIVHVREQFNLGRNTKIQVLVNQDVVYQFFAQPKQDYLKGMAENALRRLSGYLQQIERNKETIQKF